MTWESDSFWAAVPVYVAAVEPAQTAECVSGRPFVVPARGAHPAFLGPEYNGVTTAIHPMQYELEQARHAYFEQVATQHRRAAQAELGGTEPRSWPGVVQGVLARLRLRPGPLRVGGRRLDHMPMSVLRGLRSLA
jgi:hypothetical protein